MLLTSKFVELESWREDFKKVTKKLQNYQKFFGY